MSKTGVIRAGSRYAHLQSAAMGGYGAAVVQGVTRAGSVTFGASQRLLSHGQKSKADDVAAGEETSKEPETGAEAPLKAKL